METDEKEHNCKNCKYYVEHYIIATETQFFPIGGHCIHPTVINLRGNKRYKIKENCENWECNAECKAKRRQSIDEVLRSMNTRLLHIMRILEIDKN